MYRIVGADGKEYGPISLDQLRQWVAEGRANAQTQVSHDGVGDWKPLAQFPELAALLGAAAPAPSAPYPGPLPAMGSAAADAVNGPAIGLICVAILGFLLQIVGLISNLAGIGMAGMRNNQSGAPPWVNMMSGTVGVVAGLIGILTSVVILLGALKMKKLESHGFAMAASIIAMIPCVSPCCLVGLPIGIWALVILSKPEVKSAFQ